MARHAVPRRRETDAEFPISAPVLAYSSAIIARRLMRAQAYFVFRHCCITVFAWMPPFTCRSSTVLPSSASW